MSITLAQLEQETARRLGPFYNLFADRQVPGTATFTYAMFPELRSNIDLDSVTNLWVLRRGKIYGDPTASVSMDVVDRQRLVASYEPEAGRVFVDRPWQSIPVPGEMCEFHHLDPEQQLRATVMAGLRRCFVADTVMANPTHQYGGIDLTMQYPWLTQPWQVTRVRYGWTTPYGDAPWDSYTTMGHLILTNTFGTNLPMTVWVDSWRPAWTLVNGAESTSGPTQDDDILEVDLDYAASGAHIEAWHLFPSRLQAAAAGNNQATREQAASEFTRQAIIYGPKRPSSVGFQDVVRITTRGSNWVNGPW